MPRKKLPEDSKKTALTQRKRPQQQRSLVTMQSIHQAALELIAQGGFETLSAARIAERAGIGVGSFYDYYSNKEALLTDLYASASSALVKRMRENLPRILDLPVEETVALTVKEVVGLYEEHRAVLIDLPLEHPEIKLDINPLSFEQLTHGSILIYLQHRGKPLQPDELETKAFFLEHVIVGCIRQYLSNPPPQVSREAFIANLTQIITPYMKEITAPDRLELRGSRVDSARSP
ncbi:MAG TPA: TetR/AcrR family transcriptional regulator [Steroidobacteraceae bacterium]|nr:TetR/AcrR family transcriptional regulator [Steroidobacteraceae bacterium]